MRRVKFVTGAYAWVNKVNGKRYVGGAYKSFKKRFSHHRHHLNAGTHCNRYLQRAWNKYGAKAFDFQILERCSPDKVQKVEQKWINKYWTADRQHVYNLSPTAGSPLGTKHSEEANARMSEIKKSLGPPRHLIEKAAEVSKKYWSKPGAKKKQSELMKKHWSNPEFKAKMRSKGLERWRDSEYRAKQTKINQEMWTPERRAKCAEKSKKAWADSEAKARRVAAQVGKKRSEEFKLKQAEAAKRHWADPEVRARMVEARRKRELQKVFAED